MTPGHWILTAHGADHPITGLHLLQGDSGLRIEVIAHSLAQINRFTGHAERPYSVAEHSLLVCDIVASMGLGCHAQMLALLHDAHECIVGDVATPVKSALGTPWLAFENTHALAVRHAFDLRCAHAAYRRCVKAADLRALATERRDLLRFDAATSLPWPVLDTPGAEVLPMDGVHLNTPVRAAMSWRHHRDAFLERFRRLSAARADPPVNPFDQPAPETTA